MKVCFVAINAKYIHTSPAVRILYKVVKLKSDYDVNFFEFTIKDNLNNIIDVIKNYDYIGLSCYIWNIDMMIDLSKKIKEIYPNKIVFSGGPEVSYDVKSFVNDFDYVMSGEGEEMIVPFLDYLSKKRSDLVDGIAYLNHTDVKAQVVCDLNNVPDILDTYTLEDRLNRIIYVETNRGCPFKCSYCLSSVTSGVRYFSDEYVNHIFDYIINNKFKCVKFLDRTFNVKPSRFLKICKILEQTSNTYQFEVEPSLFNEEVINYFENLAPINKFRLEVGIQSLNDEAIKAVDRVQDGKHILEVLKRIQNGRRCTIHVDLIAGLPYEDYQSFKNTFNKTFLIMCEELQLGFLKMLRGTKIRREAYKFNYEYDNNAPYEVKSNKFLNVKEMTEIHDCENILEWMYNDKRCLNFINHLVKSNIIDDYFDFFKDFNKYYDKLKPLYQNYISLIKYLKEKNIYNDEFLYDLKLDYLTKVKVKPYPFWKERDENTIDFFKRDYNYQALGLDQTYHNAFITKYYDKYIVIKYVDGLKPDLKIMNLVLKEEK